MGNKNILIPFYVIKSATEGDSKSINKILAFYSGYIFDLCSKSFIFNDETVGYIDRNMRHNLEVKLIEAISNFNINET